MRAPRPFAIDFLIRLAIGMTIGMAAAFLISQGSFLFLPDKQTPTRPPQEVTLVIPFGTSEQVAAGVDNRELPSDMTFVEGDVLIVKNEDVVPHQLGPLWVPAKASSVLQMSKANTYAYECSFEPTRYLGITVKPRVNTSQQVEALLAIGLPTGMMITIYSYLLPSKNKKPADAAYNET